MSGANSNGESRSQWAVVKLSGAREMTPGALLEMAEGVRRALRLVGVTQVRIELEADEDDVA